MRYVKRFEDGRCCKLEVTAECATLFTYGQGSFACQDSLVNASLPGLLTELLARPAVHPDIIDFMRTAWLMCAADLHLKRLNTLSPGHELTVKELVYRLSPGGMWCTSAHWMGNQSPEAMASMLAGEDFDRLFGDRLDYEEIE